MARVWCWDVWQSRRTVGAQGEMGECSFGVTPWASLLISLLLVFQCWMSLRRARDVDWHRVPGPCFPMALCHQHQDAAQCQGSLFMSPRCLSSHFQEWVKTTFKM